MDKSKFRKDRFTDYGGEGTEIRGPDGKLVDSKAKAPKGGKKPSKPSKSEKRGGQSMHTLRISLIRLAHAKPELREHLLPLLKEAAVRDTPLDPRLS